MNFSLSHETGPRWITAIADAFLFALGIVTPIAMVAYILQRSDIFVRHRKWFQRASVLLLVLASYHFAYLAGASWRWVP